MCKSENSSAKTALVSDFVTCRASLRRLVAKVVRSQDVEDILQETFIRTYSAADETKIQSPRSFMHRIAWNLALNHIMAANQIRTHTADVASSLACPTTESLESKLQSEEQFAAFNRAVRRLPSRCRRVFVLRKVLGLSQKEISASLGISESTIEKHVAKGLSLCREAMLETDALDALPPKTASAR